MNCIELKREILKTYKNDSKITLRILIFLTRVLKNLHREEIVFFLLFGIVFATAVGMYLAGASLLPLIAGSTVIYFLSYKITLHFIFDYKEFKETYLEQSCIEETLIEIMMSK